MDALDPILIPCLDEADLADFKEICGEVDVLSGRPVVYYVDRVAAKMLEREVSRLTDALSDLDLPV